MHPIRIEYGEEYVDPDKELEVYASSPDNIRIVGVDAIGDQLRFRYLIFWENGEDARR